MTQHDLLVIGAGPGGYVAAIRAAQLGMNVGCIDANSALGGTCLRVGCIPSKALLESTELYWAARNEFAAHGLHVGDISYDLPTMMLRKTRVVESLTRGVDMLFKKNGITRYLGLGTLIGDGHVELRTPDGATQTLSAQHILIATGSKAATLPGIDLDGEWIGTSTEALAYQRTPRTLAVIGAGYIGLELASVWNRLGTKVIVLEYLDRVLPGMDSEIATEAQKLLTRQGIEFRLGVRVTGAAREGDDCVVELANSEPVSCDRVLVAVGRRPNTDGLGLEGIGVASDEKGRITVDEHFATSAPGIYAVGDVIRGPMLAHKASDEGVACVEHLATGVGHVNYDAIPGVVYTHPEIASVGKTEDELKAAGRRYRKGVYQFRGNGRARALDQIDGKIKVLADAESDLLLGVHIIGPRAGDLIAEAAVAIEFSATSEDLARCTYAHPTLSEVLKEALLAASGRAIHA
jgi:dihydrolipoamide dehydrogenase